MLCDDLEGGMEGGRVGRRLMREGIYAYMELVHFVSQQKLSQHCKQLYLNFLRKGTARIT